MTRRQADKAMRQRTDDQLAEELAFWQTRNDPVSVAMIEREIARRNLNQPDPPPARS